MHKAWMALHMLQRKCGRVTETSTVITSAGQKIAPDADADATFACPGWLRLSAG